MEAPLLTKNEHNVDNVTIVWNLVELVVTLVQLVAAIVVLTLTKDEQHPNKIYVMLIISYTCGCIATLPILVWRFLHFNRIASSSEARINEVMNNLRMMVGYFFVGWITVLVWHLLNNTSSLDYTTPQFWLCLAFFAVSCILHVFLNICCSVMCFFLPMLPRFLVVLDFVDDIDDKITLISYSVVLCFSIFLCICLCISKSR